MNSNKVLDQLSADSMEKIETMVTNGKKMKTRLQSSQQSGKIYFEGSRLLFISRGTEKYVPHNLVERYIMPKIRKVFTRRLLKGIPFNKVKMITEEAINFNKFRPSRKLYQKGDYMYNLEDLLKVWMFFKAAEDIVHKEERKTPLFGFVSISNNLVPFVYCGGNKFVPLFYFHGNSTILDERTFLVTDPWHLGYLRFCFAAQNIREKFQRLKSITVVNMQDIKDVFPGESFNLGFPSKINSKLLTANQNFLMQQKPAPGPTKSTLHMSLDNVALHCASYENKIPVKNSKTRLEYKGEFFINKLNSPSLLPKVKMKVQSDKESTFLNTIKENLSSNINIDLSSEHISAEKENIKKMVAKISSAAIEYGNRNTKGLLKELSLSNITACEKYLKHTDYLNNDQCYESSFGTIKHLKDISLKIKSNKFPVDSISSFLKAMFLQPLKANKAPSNTTVLVERKSNNLFTPGTVDATNQVIPSPAAVTLQNNTIRVNSDLSLGTANTIDQQMDICDNFNTTTSNTKDLTTLETVNAENEVVPLPVTEIVQTHVTRANTATSKAEDISTPETVNEVVPSSADRTVHNSVLRSNRDLGLKTVNNIEQQMDTYDNSKINESATTLQLSDVIRDSSSNSQTTISRCKEEVHDLSSNTPTSKAEDISTSETVNEVVSSPADRTARNNVLRSNRDLCLKTVNNIEQQTDTYHNSKITESATTTPLFNKIRVISIERLTRAPSLNDSTLGTDLVLETDSSANPIIPTTIDEVRDINFNNQNTISKLTEFPSSNGMVSRDFTFNELNILQTTNHANQIIPLPTTRGILSSIIRNAKDAEHSLRPNYSTTPFSYDTRDISLNNRNSIQRLTVTPSSPTGNVALPNNVNTLQTVNGTNQIVPSPIVSTGLDKSRKQLENIDHIAGAHYPTVPLSYDTQEINSTDQNSNLILTDAPSSTDITALYEITSKYVGVLRRDNSRVESTVPNYITGSVRDAEQFSRPHDPVAPFLYETDSNQYSSLPGTTVNDINILQTTNRLNQEIPSTTFNVVPNNMTGNTRKNGVVDRQMLNSQNFHHPQIIANHGKTIPRAIGPGQRPLSRNHYTNYAPTHRPSQMVRPFGSRNNCYNVARASSPNSNYLENCRNSNFVNKPYQQQHGCTTVPFYQNRYQNNVPVYRTPICHNNQQVPSDPAIQMRERVEFHVPRTERRIQESENINGGSPRYERFPNANYPTARVTPSGYSYYHHRNRRVGNAPNISPSDKYHMNSFLNPTPVPRDCCTPFVQKPQYYPVQRCVVE